MEFTFYEMIWIFYIYAFLGWCSEVIFAASVNGKFTNRGFDIGPICPIYGFGILVILICLNNIKSHILLLFVSSVFLASLLEFIAGFILEKVFHEKWWDYSDEPFNLKGYICLRFSLLWGLACMLVVNVIHPVVNHIIQIIPIKLGIPLLIMFTLVFISDFIITIINLMKIRKNIKAVNEIECALETLSSTIGNNLSNRTVSALSKKEHMKEAVSEIISEKQYLTDAVNNSKDEIEALKEKLQKHKDELTKLSKRLRSAFPNISKHLTKK